MSVPDVQIAPSVLPADFSRLGETVEELEQAGADRSHWDVMDGVFVPNLTIGPDVIHSCRPRVEIPFEALRVRLTDGDPGTLKVFYNVATVLAHRLAAMDKKLSEVADDTPERTADLVAFHNKLYGEWNI